MSRARVTDLPHSNDSISDEDKKNDEGLHEGGDGLLAFLKPGQHLESGQKRVNKSLQTNSCFNIYTEL